MAFVFLFVLGLLLIFGTPQLDAPDEFYHWQRAVQIAKGQFLAERVDGEWGGEIDQAAFAYQIWFLGKTGEQPPIRVDDAWNEAKQASLLPDTDLAEPFPSAASFSPIAYLPQAFGIALARLIGANVFVQVVMGRIAALVSYFAAAWAVCRTLPGARYIGFAALTVPSILYLAGTLSADSMNLALPALLIALCLRLRADGDFALTGGRRWLIGALAVACGLLKVTSPIFCLALLLIPASKFRNGLDRGLFPTACLAASVLAALSWNLAFPFVPGIFWHNGADPGAMIHMALSNPGHAVVMICDAARFWWIPWFQGYYGMVGAHQGFGYSLSYPWFLTVASIGAALAIVDGMPRRDWRQAFWLAGMAALCLTALLSAFLIGYTQLGAAMVEGMNGRYLFPFYLLALLSVASLRLTGRWLTVVRPAAFLTCMLAEGIVTGAALVTFHGLWVY
jgi:uncharacterized membrane protein